MDWTIPNEPLPDEIDAARTFAGGAIQLRRRGKTVWIEIAPYPVVAIEFVSLTELFEHPDLAARGTERAIASPPMAYLLIGRDELGLQEVTTGEYELTWIDLAEGRVAAVTRELDGGDESFAPPISGPVALALRRLGR